MSTPNIIQEHYSDISFTAAETSQLSSKFLDFSQIWNLTISLIKNQFRRAFLAPMLWQLAIFMVGFILFGALSFDQLSKYVPSNTQEIAGENWAGFAAAFQIFFQGLLILIVCLVMSSLISIRQNYILNHKSIAGIWQTNRGFYIPLLKLIGIGLVVGVVFGLIGGVMGGLFSSFDTDGNISSVVVNILQIAFFGLFGLYTSLIILEDRGMVESLEISLNLMKPIFWKNVLRWLIFNLIGFGISLLLLLPVGLILLVSYGSLLASLYDGSQGIANSGGVIISILGIFVILASVALSMLQTAFIYTSFINIRLSSFKPEMLVMTESEKEAIPKEMPALEQETPSPVTVL